MHFTLTQQTIAIFALLSICAHAYPMPGGEIQVSGLLLGREEATWCAGLTDDECKAACKAHGFPKSNCNTKYVKLY
jgi:hypothetical protein